MAYFPRIHMIAFFLSVIGFMGGLILCILAALAWSVEVTYLGFTPAKGTVTNCTESGIGLKFLKKTVDFQYLADKGNHLDGYQRFRSIGCFGRDYNPGQNITVYVNPINPKEAVIDDGPTWQTYLLFAIGLFLTLIFGRNTIRYISHFLSGPPLGDPRRI